MSDDVLVSSNQQQSTNKIAPTPLAVGLSGASGTRTIAADDGKVAPNTPSSSSSASGGRGGSKSPIGNGTFDFKRPANCNCSCTCDPTNCSCNGIGCNECGKPPVVPNSNSNHEFPSSTATSIAELPTVDDEVRSIDDITRECQTAKECEDKHKSIVGKYQCIVDITSLGSLISPTGIGSTKPPKIISAVQSLSSLSSSSSADSKRQHIQTAPPNLELTSSSTATAVSSTLACGHDSKTPLSPSSTLSATEEEKQPYPGWSFIVRPDSDLVKKDCDAKAIRVAVQVYCYHSFKVVTFDHYTII
jgi:hypothetical protein